MNPKGPGGYSHTPQDDRETPRVAVRISPDGNDAVREARGYVEVAGKPVAIDHPVVDGRCNDAWWEPGDGMSRKRLHGVRSVVWHHTAGEGSWHQVVNTLRTRGLSIHFIVDWDGTIVQCADPATTITYHAGAVNSYSIGVEMVCRGVWPSTGGHKRNDYWDDAHGKQIRFLRLYPAQVTAAHELARALSLALDIPPVFPKDHTGRVLRRTLDPAAVNTWRGFLGHLHISPQKIDPTPHIMDELAARFVG